MALYMHIKGIRGDVNAKGHENWIALSACTFAIHRSVSTHNGVIVGRRPSLPVFSDIEINKVLDSSSNDLLTYALHGQALPEVTIDCCHTQSSLQPYLQYKLHNVIITHRRVLLDGNYPQEILTLNFTKIEEHFIPVDQSQKAQSPLRTGYDLASATIC